MCIMLKELNDKSMNVSLLAILMTLTLLVQIWMDSRKVYWF